MPTFDRTADCACHECVQCCKDQPGPLAPGDLEQIAAYLGKPVQAVLTRFWASPGAVLQSHWSGEMYRVGTITPQRRQGRCVFLGADERCTIHPVAPFGCAYFDTHQSPDEYQKRGRWLYATIQADRAYQSLRRTLTIATSYRPRLGKPQ